MTTFIVFAILGVGSGAAFAILALGVVLIQRGSGTINFAQGSIGMFSAFVFAELVNNHMPKALAVVVVLAGAALFGALWHLVVMRNLRNSPALARVIATLGLLAALQGAALLRYGNGIRQAQSVLPKGVVRISSSVVFGQDRLWLLGITIVVTLFLWAWYRFTVFGISTRAAAESERGAALLGYSPDLIAAANWAIGCALGAIAGILIAPIVGLSVGVLTLLILPGFAAALLGRFTSFGITAAAGIAIGSAQSLVGNYWTQPGVIDALPFVIVIVAMVVTGRSIPERGTLATARQPLAPGSSRLTAITGIAWGLLLASALVGAFLLDNVYRSALTTSLIAVIAALSVVVITGLVGQTSIMPMTFAGIGGLLTSKFAHDWGLPFPVPILVAAVCMVPIGALLGLPALRVRGLNLAVVTVGAAVAVSAVLFNNSDWTGGVAGSLVPSPSIFGYSLDASLFPIRFAVLCIVIAATLIWMIRNLRRSPSGLRMLSVRSNERAAAISGMNVASTKLQAFALSAAIAAVSGALLSYQIGAVSFDRFDVFGSIALITLVYIGGVAVVGGAIVAGLAVNGGIFYLLLDDKISGLSQYYAGASGLLLIVTVVLQPDGIVVAGSQQLRKTRGRKGGQATHAMGSSQHAAATTVSIAEGDRLSDVTAH